MKKSLTVKQTRFLIKVLKIYKLQVNRSKSNILSNYTSRVNNIIEQGYYHTNEASARGGGSSSSGLEDDSVVLQRVARQYKENLPLIKKWLKESELGTNEQKTK
jgi:hypothetical protein